WRAVPFLLIAHAIAFGLPVLDRERGYDYFLMGLWWCWLPPFLLFSESTKGNILEVAALFAWWANPCFWLACAMAALRRPPGSAVLGTLGVALSLGFLFNNNRHWPGAGYWLWTASMAGLALTGLVALFKTPPGALTHLRHLANELEYESLTGSHDDRIR